METPEAYSQNLNKTWTWQHEHGNMNDTRDNVNAESVDSWNATKANIIYLLKKEISNPSEEHKHSEASDREW